MLESRIIANLMKIDIALIQSYIYMYFKSSFENTIHPQIGGEFHIIFSPSRTPN